MSREIIQELLEVVESLRPLLDGNGSYLGIYKDDVYRLLEIAEKLKEGYSSE